ncbi:hypothetical protein K439DRAFT_1387932 [Ramaria rubella]|nr:hypothetical protein K439DRAFT_1387932 [Ramaria rubella]
MAFRLADELLQMILAPSLTVSRGQLVSPEVTAFGHNDTVSSSSALLVCKRWLRVATPLLYETIVIRSTGQAYALAKAFQLNPSFAKFVRNLRLEGSYVALGQILASCKAVSTLVMLLRIYSDANVSGLCRGLSSIDPKEVILYDEGRVDNAKIRQVLVALHEAIPNWNNLTAFGFPYIGPGQGRGLLDRTEGSTRRKSGLVDALSKSKSLRLVFGDLPVTRNPTWVLDFVCAPWQSHIPTARIRLEYNSTNYPFMSKTVEDAQDALLVHKQLSSSSFEFIDLADATFGVVSRKQKRSKPVITPYSFKSESVMAVPDELWATIFTLASTPGEHNAKQCNANRKGLSLVCKRFARIVMPLFIKAPLITSLTSLQQFTETVHQSPQLAHRIHVLSIGEYFSLRGSSICLGSLLPRFTSLRDLTLKLNYAMITFTPDEFERIAKAVGDSLLSLRLEISTNGPISPAAFDFFKKLVKLYVDLPNGMTVEAADPRSHSLITLRELHIHEPSSLKSVLPAFSVFALPKLTSLKIVRTTTPALENFMEASGSHVQELDFLGTANFADLFLHSPNLRSLCWGCSSMWLKESETIQSSLNPSAYHGKLQKFSVKGIPSLGAGEKEQALSTKTFFDFLNLSNFPSLKEIQFVEYTWPVEERAIRKDILTSIAVSVKKEHSLDITDRTGKPWRPRVQIGK